jgi:hypothetical protein
MTDDEDEIEFLRTTPPRPKLLAVPSWHGGSEVPTRKAFGDGYEDAMLNYHKHIAINEHNARLLQAHEDHALTLEFEAKAAARLASLGARAATSPGVDGAA